MTGFKHTNPYDRIVRLERAVMGLLEHVHEIQVHLGLNPDGILELDDIYDYLQGLGPDND